MLILKRLKITLLVAILVCSIWHVKPVDGKMKVAKDSLKDEGIQQIYNSTPNNSTLYYNQYYSTQYFYNLTHNFGNNLVGSCGYVAMGMLLSYWDTYWDDNVIPENYDMISLLDSNELNSNVESPGIYREPSYIPDESYDEYYQSIEQYSSAHFHLNLIKMGKEVFHQYQFDNQSSPTGMNFYQSQELLNYYLYNYRGYTPSDVIFNGADDPRSFAINEIKRGNPVVLCVEHENNSSGHIVIAYDYDLINDEIYVHPGWGSALTHVTLNSIGYDKYWWAYSLDFNNSHQCSDNYKYSDGYNLVKTHCSCELEVHPEYVHHHIFECKYYDTSYHTLQCRCGVVDASSKQHHSVYASSISPSRYAPCIGCKEMLNLKRDKAYVIADNLNVFNPIQVVNTLTDDPDEIICNILLLNLFNAMSY